MNGLEASDKIIADCQAEIARLKTKCNVLTWRLLGEMKNIDSTRAELERCLDDLEQTERDLEMECEG